MNADLPRSRSYRVADLRKGDRITGGVFLVEASNFKQTRSQKYFIQMALRDSSGSVRALVWEATQELYRSFQVGDFLRIDGRVEEFQNQRQVIVDQLTREDPDSIDYGDFLPVSARPIDEMEQELRQAIGEVRRAPLRQLLLAIIDDPEIRPALRAVPAGKALHHACVGGLLEHICSLIGAARQLTRHYPQLDRDLLY
ncbi:MAG TPA: OB-fold nucleic acid binding domain-containing protein, partial [Planctomycetota bacterium]|nr:OB-fold nucleic acid binding domain-containing protein [Planctomycetota bacterium]